MKNNSEIRGESLACAKQGKWFFRFMLAGIVFGGLSGLVDGLMDSFYKANGIQTWFGFFHAKFSAASQGLMYSTPSSSASLQMHGASLFSVFIKLVFAGISYVAVAGVYLKAARKKEDRWLADALSVFARPLGCAWLVFVVFLRIWLWSLLLVVPGIIACYRYSQVWNIKSDHPDWGASRCIAESARLMKGFKMQRFRLDVSFVMWFFAAMIPLIALHAARELLPGTFSGFILLCGIAICLAAFVFIGIWMAAARAVFYRAVCEVAASGESVESAGL